VCSSDLRWEYASGWRNDFFDDTLVCASKGLPQELVEKFQTFDTKQLMPYQPQFLAGWRAETYAIDLMPAWGTAQDKMSDVQRGRCSGDVPGDTQRNLAVQNYFSAVTFKHILLPIWIAAYRYNDKPFQFLVNGQTGEVVGKAPWSFWKIFFTVLAVLAISIGGYFIYERFQKPKPQPDGTPTVQTSVPAVPPAATTPAAPATLKPTATTPPTAPKPTATTPAKPTATTPVKTPTQPGVKPKSTR
jgi:hypothetical protein